MTEPTNQEPFERQIEALVSVGRVLGFNPVRMRWKLRALAQRWVSRTRLYGQRVRHVGYANKVCPRCGAVQATDDSKCSQCGSRLDSRPVQLLRRVGVITPQFVSMNTVLCVLILVVYGAVVRDDPTGNFFSLSVEALYRHGGHLPAAVNAGQWWRLGSAIFLHAGLWHLGFNVIALAQVGPQIEELFGKIRLIIFFVLTGVFANIVSNFWIQGVGIGASGALMGLIGVAAGWGHRDGTSVGLRARNSMLQWALYTLVFGWFIGANNVAHAAGFVSGATLGYLVLPAYRRDAAIGPLTSALFVVSLLIIAVSVAFALAPQLAAAVWPV
jgi:rhomboid protease GluP